MCTDPLYAVKLWGGGERKLQRSLLALEKTDHNVKLWGGGERKLQRSFLALQKTNHNAFTLKR